MLCICCKKREALFSKALCEVCIEAWIKLHLRLENGVDEAKKRILLEMTMEDTERREDEPQGSRMPGAGASNSG